MTITLFNICITVQCIPDPQMWHGEESGGKIIEQIALALPTQNCAKMIETIEYPDSLFFI